MRRTIDYIRRNPRALFFLYLPAYLTWFVLLESRVHADYYVCHLPVDDMIPFIPAFAAAYVIWYPFMFFPAAYLYFKDARAFVRFGAFFVISFSACLLVCTVFPNGQDLRPADPGTGFFPWLVKRLYDVDTNTNVLPSMHVVGCAGIAFAALDSPTLRKVRWPLIVLGVLIVASTVFIKQHSMLDVIWGLAAAVVAAVPAYFRRVTGIGTKPSGRAS